jgi:hypothetical protein
LKITNSTPRQPLQINTLYATAKIPQAEAFLFSLNKYKLTGAQHKQAVAVVQV